MLEPEELQKRLETLQSSFKRVRTDLVARACDAETADVLARNFGRMRADPQGREGRLYRLGAAVEAAGGLSINDYLLLGVLISEHSIDWLTQSALRKLSDAGHKDGISLIELIGEIAVDARRRRYLIELAAWQRHEVGRTAREIALVEFESSAMANEISWRTRHCTKSQLRAIDEISRGMRAIDPNFIVPAIATRGEAYEFIKTARQHPAHQRLLQRPTFEEQVK